MKKFVFILLIILLLPNYVMASQNDRPTDKPSVGDKQLEDFYDYINNMKTEYELLKDIDIKQYVQDVVTKGDGDISTEKLINAVLIYAGKEIAASLKLMAILIIISIICSLLTNLQSAFSNESISNIAFYACYALLIIIMAKSFFLGVDVARTTISKMAEFMGAIMPILVILLASVGGFAEAATIDPIVIGSITVFTKVYVGFIIPMICMSFVLKFVNNISGQYKIERLTKLLNQTALWTQGFLMTAFVGVMTVRGISAKTIDQVTAKTVKYTVDSFVPFVGKPFSDAVSTVAGYALLMKNAVSSAGLVIIIVIVLMPIVKLLAMALIYKLTSALIEPISDSRLVSTINAAGDSLIMIMSSLISVSVMFFILLAITASAGKMAVGG